MCSLKRIRDCRNRILPWAFTSVNTCVDDCLTDQDITSIWEKTTRLMLYTMQDNVRNERSFSLY